MKVKELKEKLEGFDDNYEIVFREDIFDSDLELTSIHYRGELQLWFDCSDLIKLNEELEHSVNHNFLSRNDIAVISSHVEDIYDIIEPKDSNKSEWIKRCINNCAKDNMIR